MTPLHGIASRDDLPLPFPLVVTAAAVVLLVTFWILAFAWREPRLRDATGKPLPRLTGVVDSPWFSRPLRLVVGAVWVLAAIAMMFGVDRIDNPIFGFIFVWLWVGLVPASLLLGGIYRRTNPTRLLLRMVGATAPAANESRQSRLPAAAALLAFLYLELVEPDALTLAAVRGFAAAWLAWVVGGVFLRSSNWIAQADPFEVFASTIARFSPWTRSPTGTLLWLNPLRNLASWRAPRHLSVLAAVLLGGTLFDAASASAWWVRLTQNSPLPPRLAGTIGLLATVTLIWGLFMVCVVPLRHSNRGLRDSADALAPGLVPLVAGYFIAHYATMFYLEGQRTAIRFSDPLGAGLDLFGIAEAGPGTALLAHPMLISVLQVLVIVGGHVAGALVTHDIALRHPDGAAVRRQAPLLSFMVALTVGGMLLMFGE